MKVKVTFNVKRIDLIIAAGECIDFGDKPTKKNILTWLRFSYMKWGNGAELFGLQDSWKYKTKILKSATKHVDRLFPDVKE